MVFGQPSHQSDGLTHLFQVRVAALAGPEMVFKTVSLFGRHAPLQVQGIQPGYLLHCTIKAWVLKSGN